jgi:hypothetical protein
MNAVLVGGGMARVVEFWHREEAAGRWRKTAVCMQE